MPGLMRLSLTRIATWALATAVCAPALAQQTVASYPSRPVILVVPFTAGSGSDIIARIITPRLSERWKQAVVVENRAGASGNLGADRVAKAAPDGLTLLMAINTFTMTLRCIEPCLMTRIPTLRQSPFWLLPTMRWWSTAKFLLGTCVRWWCLPKACQRGN